MTASTVAVARPEAPEAGRDTRSRIALAIIVACQLMVVLDATVVNIALPSIQSSLGFSPTGLSWVVNAYALTFGGLLLLGGRAGDLLGRRRVFVAGILVFTAGSLLGGFAGSAGWLLAARVLQGVGGAVASPTALALISTNFEEGPARNSAFSFYAAVSAAGASLGLIAGGVLTSWASWRWVLFVNVPIGVAVTLLTPLFIRESERRPGRFDLAGAATSTAGMVSLVYAFIHASTAGWGDGLTLAAFAAAAGLLALFVAVELRTPQPITPLHLFADRNRTSAHVTRLLLLAGMFGMFFFLTQFLQDMLGFSPLQAGLAFLPMTMALFASARTASRLLPQFGARRLTVGGAAVTAAGMAWLAQISLGSSYLTAILGPMLLIGIGMGFPFMSLTLVALSGVEPRDAGAASSLVNVVQQVGGALGLAVLVTVFGAAGRSAAGHALGGAAAQAQWALAGGISGAFSAGLVLTVCAVVVALVAIDDEGHP
jgi:EmrB/QacA subfamily drug resistance transporter